LTDSGPAGSIQPAGFLLGVSEDWLIEMVSANIGDFVPCNPANLFGRPASDVLAEDTVHALRNRLAMLRDPEGVERLLGCRLTEDGRSFDLAIHYSGDRIIIEAEPASAKTYGDMTATLRGMFARIDQGVDLADVLREATQQMRALTGFDRVLMLRFNRDWSSEVVAEYARGGVASLLGEHIAAACLPFEERRCLERAPLHLSADLEAELVPLSFDDRSEFPDLSRAILRPLAPAYADQLRTMVARAAISIALVVGGSLWGLIVCLHHQPRGVGFERRSVADLFAQLLASRIEIYELKTALANTAHG